MELSCRVTATCRVDLWVTSGWLLGTEAALCTRVRPGITNLLGEESDYLLCPYHVQNPLEDSLVDSDTRPAKDILFSPFTSEETGAKTELPRATLLSGRTGLELGVSDS